MSVFCQDFSMGRVEIFQRFRYNEYSYQNAKMREKIEKGMRKEDSIKTIKGIG